jgi:hypothetical protein
MLHDKIALIPGLTSMKFYKLFLFLFILSASLLQAQAVLPFAINKEGLPTDTSKLSFSQSEGGITPGFFSTCGIQINDFAPDFVLYDTAGTACQLSKMLTDGKPVLLIAASYTCPQSRKNIKDKLEILTRLYSDKVNIRLIYTIEAHPVEPDICPYTGAVYTTGANFRDSILFRQPETYLQRKKMAARLIRELKITVPVLIDTPDNAWWRNFGPAPNNAYLISPRGVVIEKYGWLENPNFGTDITDLLKDKAAMQTNTQNEIYIEKDKGTGWPMLFIKESGRSFSVDVYDASGEIIYTIVKDTGSPLGLNTIPVAKEEYKLVVKISEGQSYCLPYRSDKP